MFHLLATLIFFFNFEGQGRRELCNIAICIIQQWKAILLIHVQKQTSLGLEAMTGPSALSPVGLGLSFLIFSNPKDVASTGLIVRYTVPPLTVIFPFTLNSNINASIIKLCWRFVNRMKIKSFFNTIIQLTVIPCNQPTKYRGEERYSEYNFWKSKYMLCCCYYYLSALYYSTPIFSFLKEFQCLIQSDHL